jgi:hypothetical protein
VQRTLIFLCLILGPSCSQAQTLYAGVSASLLTDGRYSSPFIGVQFGAELADNLELRAAFDTQIYTSSLAADLLYRISLEGGFSTYLGAGSEVLFLPLLQPTPASQVAPFQALGTPIYALRGTLGLEVRTKTFGFFGEVQPTFPFTTLQWDSARFRAGVNYLF